MPGDHGKKGGMFPPKKEGLSDRINDLKRKGKFKGVKRPKKDTMKY